MGRAALGLALHGGVRRGGVHPVLGMQLPGRSPPDPYPFLRLGLQTEGWYTEQWEHKHWAFLSRQRPLLAATGSLWEEVL